MPAARVSDLHVCPMVTGIVPHVGGPVLSPCMPTVLTMSLPQARVTDLCTCAGPPDMIVKGSSGVLVGKLPAARMLDMTAHGGTIVGPCAPTVLIGETASGAAGGPNTPPMVDVASGAAAIGAAGAQAKALIGAHQSGAYFCRRCHA